MAVEPTYGNLVSDGKPKYGMKSKEAALR